MNFQITAGKLKFPDIIEIYFRINKIILTDLMKNKEEVKHWKIQKICQFFK